MWPPWTQPSNKASSSVAAAVTALVSLMYLASHGMGNGSHGTGIFLETWHCLELEATKKHIKKMGTEQPDVCEGRSECLEKPKTVFAGAFPNMTTGELIRPLSRVIYGWGRVPDQVKGPNEVKRAQCSWCSIKSAKLERAKWCCKKKGISSAINHYNDFSPCDVGIDHNSWANQSTTLAQFGQGNPPKQSSILGWLFHVKVGSSGGSPH